MKEIPLIIDTDFGGDPDDAIALLYALNSPEITIHAIYTSDEFDGDKRARALHTFLQSEAYKIPVQYGVDLGNTNLFLLDEFVDQHAQVDNLFSSFKTLQQLQYLVEHDGTYVSIGGLSNLSRLYTLYPAIIRQLNIIVMGGAFHYYRPGVAEHNIRIDVEAARHVFNEHLQTQWLLSDLTSVSQTRISPAHPLYEHVLHSADRQQQMVARNMQRFYTEKYPQSNLHDPIAIASTFSDIAVYKQKAARMLPNGELKVDPSGSEHRFIDSIDYQRFWEDISRKIGIHV